MAHVYVDSNAAGAGTGADWTNAYTTLAVALAAKAAGDDFWVAHNHAETTASAIALTSPGTAASPCRITCVTSAGTVPPVAADLRTTGTIASTGASDITYQGFAYCYGLTITAANTSSNGSHKFGASAAMKWTMEACGLILGTTNASAAIIIGTTGAVSYAVDWINTTVRFGHVSQSILAGAGVLRWRNTASAVVAAGSIPTILFTNSTAGRTANASIEGVDLSALGVGKTIFGASINAVQFTAKDCKLGASVTMAVTPTALGQRILFSRCSDTAGNYIEQLYTYQGTQTDELTIVRSGGASDGTTPKSRKIVTTANSKWISPFEAIPIAIWNDVAGVSRTITVYGIWGDGAVPDNDEIWMDVEYLGASGNPQGSFATNTKATPLTAAAALASDASVWGGSTTAFKMTVSFTPLQKGYVYIYPKAGAASATIYIDPKVDLA